MKTLRSVLGNLFGVIFVVLSVVVTVETHRAEGVQLLAARRRRARRLRAGRRFDAGLQPGADRAQPYPRRRVPRALPAADAGGAELAFGDGARVVRGRARRRLRSRSSATRVAYRSTAQTPWATPLIYPQSGLVRRFPRCSRCVASATRCARRSLLLTRPGRRAQPRIPAEERQGRAQGGARGPRAPASVERIVDAAGRSSTQERSDMIAHRLRSSRSS